MATAFIAPRRLLQEGISGFRIPNGEFAANYLMTWADVSAETGATGLSSDPEGNYALSNPVALGPAGNIIAYGLGWYTLKLFASEAEYIANEPVLTLSIQLGVPVTG